jgi:hypothetical protein
MTRPHNHPLLSGIMIIAFGIFSSCVQGGGDKPLNQDSDKVAPPPLPSNPPDYNVFVETSGSMTGYLEADGSGFISTVTSIITSIKSYRSEGLINNLHLFYLGEATSEGMQDFNKRLNASSFKTIGKGVSDFDSFFDTVLNRVSEKEVAVLVSDMIFSPKDTKNIQNSLLNQRNGIMDKFDTRLDSMPLATLLLKYNSRFTGKYFNNRGAPAKIDASRPYYIIFIGKPAFIEALVRKVDFKSLEGFEKIHLFNAPESKSRAKIIYSKKGTIGSFDFEKPATNLNVYNAKPANNVFQFPVAVDFSQMVADESFFIDKHNYHFSAQSSNYEVAGVSPVSPTDAQYKGYTHIILLKTDNLRSGSQQVELGLSNTLPGWIHEANTDDDSDFKAAKDSAKTFGFTRLIEGVHNAYKNKYRSDLFHITITITK